MASFLPKRAAISIALFGARRRLLSGWKQSGKWRINGGSASTPMDLPSDLIDLLSAFADEQVDYLLVGGQAVALHGVPRFTKAADVRCPEATSMPHSARVRRSTLRT
jgi:hypothetical protein